MKKETLDDLFMIFSALWGFFGLIAYLPIMRLLGVI